MNSRKIVILGGGVAGLTAGWILARLGLEVTIVEKLPVCGGLAVTRRDGPYRYDLGPHNIHTRHLQLIEFLRLKFAALNRHELTSRILRQGRLIPYPIKGARVFFSLPPARMLPAVFSFTTARARMFLGEPREDGSFARWISNRFGRVLYREYFHDYPRKVWGIAPEEIDRSVAEKRIPVVGLIELVRAALFNRETRVDHPEVTDANYYLAEGIGAWPEILEKEFRAAGGRVLLERSPCRLVLDNGRVAGVTLGGDGSATRPNAETLPCDFLLSTIPIDELLPLLPKPDAAASAAAEGLDYCSACLLFLKAKRPRVLPSSLLYFTAPEIAFSRASDFSFFSDRLAPEGETIVCLELPGSAGDANWSRRDDDLAEAGSALLESEGLLQRREILGHAVERVTHAYPRFRRGYRDRVAACRRRLAECGNLISYGRQGGFSYANLDGVSLMGMHAAAAALIVPGLGVPAQTWYDAQTAAL